MKTMSRQETRRALFREAFSRISREYGGEPRQSRRAIARAAAKLRFRQAREERPILAAQVEEDRKLAEFRKLAELRALAEFDARIEQLLD